MRDRLRRLLDSDTAYTVTVIGLGMLPVVVTIVVLLIS